MAGIWGVTSPYGGGIFANLNQLQSDFYNDTTGEGGRTAYDAYLRRLGLSPQQYDFGQSKYQDVLHRFNEASFSSSDPTHFLFTDWLAKNGNDILTEQYNALPSRTRGNFRSGSWGAGRVTW